MGYGTIGGALGFELPMPPSSLGGMGGTPALGRGTAAASGVGVGAAGGGVVALTGVCIGGGMVGAAA